MKEKLQRRLLAAIDDVTSAKFFVLVTATILLFADKLDQNNWIMLAMMISGLKEAGNIAYTFKGGGQVTQTTSATPAKGLDNAQ